MRYESANHRIERRFYKAWGRKCKLNQDLQQLAFIKLRPHSSSFGLGQPMDELRDTVNRLSDRIDWLERRVAGLESLLQPAHSQAPQTPIAVNEELPATEFALPQPTRVFPVIGRAMLGIAGAYLLRAISESGVVPQLAIVVIALAYAATWLVWATRARISSLFVRLTYAVTAALILAPMLVELTLRFHILSSSATGALLIAFVLGSAFLAWSRNLLAVAWVGVATGIGTSMTLMVLSRDMVPYLSVLLATVLVSEGAAGRKRWLSLRALVAPVADMAVWTLIYAFSLPVSTRIDYVPVQRDVLLAIPSLLFLIYGGSVAFRSFWALECISVFEAIQTTVSFIVAGLAWCWFAQTTGMTLFGLACCLLAIGCYGAALVSLKGRATRNYHVYAVWSAALVLTGTFLVLPPPVASVLLSAVALAMTVVAVRTQRVMPAFQAFAYVAAAAFTSGLLVYVFAALAGALPDLPTWTAWLVAVCAVLCYGIARQLVGELWNRRLLRMLFSLLSFSVIAAFCVSGVLKFAALVVLPSASSTAVVRTLVISVFAVVLALAAGRWHRTELLWSAYCGLAFLTAKLLFEDLRTSHSGSIAVSVFLYAVALILVPRLGRNIREHAGDRQGDTTSRRSAGVDGVNNDAKCETLPRIRYCR